MKLFSTALRLLLFFTVLCGLIYPAVMTLASQFLFSDKANGSLIYKNGQLIGSELIGQSFEKAENFWGRPSAVGYNPQPSGGSNLGQVSADLKKTVDERRQKLIQAHGSEVQPPQDLLYASASGLDPHISPEAALYQVHRVAQARHRDEASIRQLVETMTEPPQWHLFGKPRVNVVLLNMALDNMKE